MSLDALQEVGLTGGGDTLLHFHMQDRIPTHETLIQLQSIANQQTKSADYTATLRDDFIFVDTTSANVAITLPASRAGKTFTFKKIVAAHTLNITPNGAETIDGAAPYALAAQWASITIKAVSGGWSVISKV